MLRPTSSTKRMRIFTEQLTARIPMFSPVLLVLVASHLFVQNDSIVVAYPMNTGTSAVKGRDYIIRTSLQRHQHEVDSKAIDGIHRVYSNAGSPSLSVTTTATAATATATTGTSTATRTSSDAIRRAWVDKSIRYYSTVMREERRKQLGQINALSDTDAAQMEFERLAYQHYFALRKVKDGKPHHAEHIYRRIINELQQEVAAATTQSHNTNNIVMNHEDDPPAACDHAKFAITTLLLALHMQRSDQNVKATRSVFLNFFRTVVAASQATTTDDDDHHPHQCACSAKVLQAFALFEMKQGNELKSLEIVLHAIRYDPSLDTILNWKQFRDVQARKQQRTIGIRP